METVKKDAGGVDVLINNAGVNLDDQYSAENAEQTIQTNVYGTLNVGGLRLLGYSFLRNRS